MGATHFRAQGGPGPNRDSLRSLRAGAVWTALPQRDQSLLLWLLQGDIVTAELAALLVHRQLRTAQRRLARLVDLGLLRGFWAASANRPRGRHAFELTKSARLDIERLAWPGGRAHPMPELPASAPIHQLATLDLLAAFLRHGDPLLGEGLVAWAPERPCGRLFDGFLRPDALALVRVRDKQVALFIERDMGTERAEVLAEKIRRYRSVLAGQFEVPLSVGFVVDSERRARTIQALLADRAGPANGLRFVTALEEHVRRAPVDAVWSDAVAVRLEDHLASDSSAVRTPILTSGCLSDDGDALAALDERGVETLPALGSHLRT